MDQVNKKGIEGGDQVRCLPASLCGVTPRSMKRGWRPGSGRGIMLLILLTGMSLAGCVSEPSRTYKKEFIITYAELTLLYERHKMEKNESDSTYQAAVDSFFAAKGLKTDEVKKSAEELSRDPQVWKLFIGDVTAAVDSLKNLQ